MGSVSPEYSMAQVFEQVLLICDQKNLLGLDLIAIDGCKMSINSSKEWSGKLADLQKKQQKIQL